MTIGSLVFVVHIVLFGIFCHIIITKNSKNKKKKRKKAKKMNISVLSCLIPLLVIIVPNAVSGMFF